MRDARFWHDATWMPWGAAQGWKPNIVQGRTENDPRLAAMLRARLAADAVARPEDLDDRFQSLDVDERTWVDRPVSEREG